MGFKTGFLVLFLERRSHCVVQARLSLESPFPSTRTECVLPQPALLALRRSEGILGALAQTTASEVDQLKPPWVSLRHHWTPKTSSQNKSTVAYRLPEDDRPAEEGAHVRGSYSFEVNVE